MRTSSTYFPSYDWFNFSSNSWISCNNKFWIIFNEESIVIVGLVSEVDGITIVIADAFAIAGGRIVIDDAVKFGGTVAAAVAVVIGIGVVIGTS